MGDIKSSASASLAALGGQIAIIALAGICLYTYVNWMAKLWHRDILMFIMGGLLGLGLVLVVVASILLYNKARKKQGGGLD